MAVPVTQYTIHFTISYEKNIASQFNSVLFFVYATEKTY